MATEAGVKHDEGKVRVGLMMNDFAQALLEVAKVNTYGAQKYIDHGWCTVYNGQQRYEDALYRHQLADALGETHDEESGLLHIAHAAWNALAILELELRKQRNTKLMDEISKRPSTQEDRNLNDYLGSLSEVNKSFQSWVESIDWDSFTEDKPHNTSADKDLILWLNNTLLGKFQAVQNWVSQFVTEETKYSSEDYERACDRAERQPLTTRSATIIDQELWNYLEKKLIEIEKISPKFIADAINWGNSVIWSDGGGNSYATIYDDKLSKWLSAALDFPFTSETHKELISRWFNSLNWSKIHDSRSNKN